MLFAMCPPVTMQTEGLESYRYDESRLTTLDGLRHDVAHRRYVPRPLPEGNADLLFMRKTALYVSGLVCHHHGVRVNMSYLRTVMRERPPPGLE